MTRSRLWTLVASVVAVLVAVAGWFLLVGPTWDEADALEESYEQQVRENETTRARLDTLSGQAEQLPDRQAELDRLVDALPADTELPGLVRGLSGLASTAGVDLVGIEPGRPAPLASTGGCSTARPTGGTDPASQTRSGTRVRQVPLRLEASGAYAAVQQFLDALEQHGRAMVVCGFTLESNQGEVGSTAASPPGSVATGDTTGGVTIRLTGRVFTAPSASASGGAPR